MKTATLQKKTSLSIALLLLAVNFAYSNPNPSQIGSAAQAEQLQQEINRYTDITQKGGWQRIILTKKQHIKGESAPAIRQLKKRLLASGDYAGDTTNVYTQGLETAIKKAQRQFGFPENGVVDAAFVQALNVPAEKRLEQLQLNVARLQTGGASGVGRTIIVNIPEYKMHVYEDGRHVFDMNVVVGKISSKTAIFNDELTHVVFSPYWNVPASIVQNEILPATKRRRNYLSANGYEITGREGGLPKIRQRPGKNNSLGQVKFLFPNEHNIYFHDSPAKSLYGNRIRAYSHGCVRVAEPQKLAEYLLGEATDWTPERIGTAMNAGKEEWVKLLTPVPVSIAYFTAWIDHEGTLNFRDDIYGLDAPSQGVAIKE